VAKLGQHLIHALDTETLEEREQRAFQRRQLHLVDVGDGSTRVTGQLDAESAAMVRAALDSLSAPCPAADGTQDPRTAEQRTADALVELARRANDACGATRRARRPPSPGRHHHRGQPAGEGRRQRRR
jgi:Domain of unknown function (DUF222)